MLMRKNKAFRLVSSISNTKKNFNDPINFRAMENLVLNRESPLPIWNENELRLLLQQNKLAKGFNLDYVIMDGGTGGGNSKRVNNYIKTKSSKRSTSDSGKIKGKGGYYKKSSKKSSGNSKINKYFSCTRK